MNNLLRRLPDIVVLVDGSGIITGANRAVTGLLGYLESELVGQSVDVLVPRRVRGRHAEHRQSFGADPSSRAMAAGRRLDAQHKDGHPVPVEISLTPLADDPGAGVLVLMRGIADRLATESRARLADAVVAAADNAVMVTDALGRIVLVNHAFTRMTGWSAAEVMGENPRFLKSGEHPPEVFRELWATLNEGRPWKGEIVNLRKDGTRYVDEQTVTPVRSPEGSITHFVAILSDVTDRHVQAARTTQKLEQLRALHDLSRLGSRATSTATFALAAADLVRARLGFQFATIDVGTLTPSGEAAPDRAEIPLSFGDESLGRLIVRFAGPPSAETHALLGAIAAQIGAVLHTLKLIDALKTRASTDSLTVLANRGALVERGNLEIERAHRYGRPLSVVLLDIDHFKQQNDQHGHLFGDEVLRVVGGILVHQRRGSDIAARYGGDELVVLLPETRLAEAQALAERIRVAISRHHWSIEGVRLSASFGVTELWERATLAELLASADQALYQAKGEGRDRVVAITLPHLPPPAGSRPP